MILYSMRVNLLVLLEGSEVTPTLCYTYQILFYPLFLFSKSFNHWAFFSAPIPVRAGGDSEKTLSPFLISFLRAWGIQRGCLPRVSEPQEQGQDCVRFSPRIAGNCIIKGARETRVHWEGELVQRIWNGRHADLRKQMLKRSGTGQEIAIKMTQGDFPGSSVVKTPCFHWAGQGFHLLWENLDSISCAAKEITQGFPHGSVVKRPPANAGDVGLIPDPGGSHMPQSNSAHVPQLFSLCSGARSCSYWAHVLQMLKPLHPGACAPQ